MFHGQVIFAVVGESRNAARHAASLAVIEIEMKSPRHVAMAGDRHFDIMPALRL